MEEDMRKIVRTARKNWKSIALLFVLSLAFFTIIGGRARYTAQSLVAVDGRESMLLQTSSKIPTDLECEKEVISGPVMDMINWSEYPRTEIDVAVEGNAIRIMSTSRDPESAKGAANAMAEAYALHAHEKKTAYALQQREQISLQIASYKQEISAIDPNDESMLEAKEKMYGKLLDRAEELDVMIGEEENQARIMQRAVLAEKTGGLSSGLLSGAALAGLIALGYLLVIEHRS